MRILVSLKPVALVWGLLSGMILIGFIASSMLDGKHPFSLIPSASHTTEAEGGNPHASKQTKSSQNGGDVPITEKQR